MTTIDRKLETVYMPEAQQGFLGKGHTARPVIQVDFSESDPFIMLMDDMLVKTDSQPVGGPHPHAGFETVTLVLEGEMGEESHALKAGDFELMTAGSGIVHTEVISQPTRMRILQLWLNLPKDKRNAQPRLQRLPGSRVPKTKSNGVEVKLYSGTFAGLSSPVQNHTPIIVAEIRMEGNSTFTESIPFDFSAFLYVLNGSVDVGEAKQKLDKDQVGWLSRGEAGTSQLKITAGRNGAHLVLYAAQPQRHPIVSHGPFIADTMDDIRQRYADFRTGKMEHITEVAEEFQLTF